MRLAGNRRRSLTVAAFLGAAGCLSAADDAALALRIREHMRQYVQQLPDYTCRVTLERFTRPQARAAFELRDRVRAEVAYTGGKELYSWPGDEHFESGIADLLPGRGLLSEGSYALHLRNLFLKDVATFRGPREEKCGAHTCLRLDFEIPAGRSGFSVSAGGGHAAAALAGAAWFEPQTLEIERLEVRVDDAPRSVRIASTRETTEYVRVRIGEGEFVLPGMSELVLRDRDGGELWNRARFDRYHRYAGSSSVMYGPVTDAPVMNEARREVPVFRGRQVTAVLDAAMSDEACIGDGFSATAADGTRVAGRVSEMRRVRGRWLVDLALEGGALVRRGVALPLGQGMKLTWK